MPEKADIVRGKKTHSAQDVRIFGELLGKRNTHFMCPTKVFVI
jgi:hypothetical protein